MDGEDCKLGCMGWLDDQEEEWDAPIDAPIIKPSSWAGKHCELTRFECEARKVVLRGTHPSTCYEHYYVSLSF